MSGSGQPDRRASRACSQEPGASARSKCPRRLDFDPGRARRDAHRDPPGSARLTAAIARLRQRDREPNGRAATGLPQRQTLARCTNSFAMDCNRHAGAEKGFRRLKAHKQLSILRAALLRYQQALPGDRPIASKNLAVYDSTDGACCTIFDRHRDYPHAYCHQYLIFADPDEISDK